MKLCDFCGFVLSESDAQCKNCSNTIPGKEHLIQTKELSFEIKETPKTKNKSVVKMLIVRTLK